MSSMLDKIKKKINPKDPEPDFDNDDENYDDETSTYVNKEVDDNEKDGDKYPMGRPNTFLNRMISHGNKKTEDEIARDAAAAEERENAKRAAAGQGQAVGGTQQAGLTN